MGAGVGEVSLAVRTPWRSEMQVAGTPWTMPADGKELISETFFCGGWCANQQLGNPGLSAPEHLIPDPSGGGGRLRVGLL